MTSWRDSITVHPLADSFPMMSDGELQELAADIKRDGQRIPVLFATINGEKVLIDGRNRLAACFMLDREPQSQVAAIEDAAEIEALILSLNVHRRHLTPEDRARYLQAVIKSDPEKSDREIARETGAHHSTVAEHRKRLETTGGVPPVRQRKGKDNRTRKLPTKKVLKDEAQGSCNTLAADLGAAINGFAVGAPEVSVDERKAQYAALEATTTEQSAVLEQHTLTIPLHTEPADVARQITDAFGGERATSIAGEILRATAPPEKEEAPKRARGRPPGSKNKAKAAL